MFSARTARIGSSPPSSVVALWPATRKTSRRRRQRAANSTELPVRMDFSLLRSLAFPGSWFLYLLRPPPPREPILDEPRELLARAELPLIPPPLIPRELPEPEVLRLPTRSPPPPPFPPRLLA